MRKRSSKLLALRETPVKDIMTPRTVTLAFDHGWTIRQVLDETKILRFGRMPVYEESIDQLSGFVLRSDILMAAQWTSGISNWLNSRNLY